MAGDVNGPRIGSLFSGYGGLDMGVMAALGGSVAWHVEFDKAPSKILAHHWPDVPNYGDVTTVDWSAVEPVDIITGGSPCQDLSHAGKRAGMTEGTRSNLWVAMREAIAALRPSLVIWENVRGAYSAAADSDVEQCAGCLGSPGQSGPALRALGRVLGDLSDLRYDAGWHGLRAADVGAPHGRFRVFVVAQDADRAARREWRLTAPRQEAGGGHGPTLADQLEKGLPMLPTPTSSDANGIGTHGDGGADLRTTVHSLSLSLSGAGDGLADAHNEGPQGSHDPARTTQAGSDGHPFAGALLPTPDASADKYRIHGDSQQSRSLAALARRGELAP